MIVIKEESFRKLIRGSLDHYSSMVLTYRDFYAFLDENGLLNKEPDMDERTNDLVEVWDSIKEDYEGLRNITKQFFAVIIDYEVDNPAICAKYMLDYLYIIYYRALFQRYDIPPLVKPILGIPYKTAYEYFIGIGGDGLYDFLFHFCLAKGLPVSALGSQNDDLFWRIINEKEYGENIILNGSDEEFDFVCRISKNAAGFLDYRLYAHMVLDYMYFLNQESAQINEEAKEELRKISEWKDDLRRIYESPEKIDFYQFLEEKCAPWAIHFPMAMLIIMNKTRNFASLRLSSVYDLVFFGPLFLKARYWDDFSKTTINSGSGDGETPSINDIKYFIALIEKEKGKRNDAHYEKMRQELSKIDSKDVKRLVIDFLKMGMWDNGKLSDPYPNLPSPRKNGKINYSALYAKLAKDQEAVNLLAITQQEFINIRPSGLIHEDYGKLVHTPIKIMERMLETELYNHRKKEMDILLDPTKKANDPRFGNIDANKLVEHQPDIAKGEKYPHDPYEMNLGTANFILRAIYKQKKRKPWFLGNVPKSNRLSHFYKHFVDEIRNDLSHVGIIDSLAVGKEIYRKVAFWFVEVLSEFDPFQV